MTTFPYSKWVEIQVFGTFCDIVFDNIADFAIIQLLNKHMTQLSENEYLGIVAKKIQKMHGMVRHFPAFLTIFFGLYGQVVDLKT